MTKTKMNKRFEVVAHGESSAELLIYGDIGSSWFDEGVEAKQVVDELAGITANTIDVRINSYGGSVADGIAIHNALQRQEAAVHVHIDGVAVSIASLIAMAGDTVTIADNALFMVHAPWGEFPGNSKELREHADVLDIYADAMSASYVAKSGQSKDDIMSLLTDGKNHWYTAAEAVEAGFADQIGEAQNFDIAASFDLSRYQDRPVALTATKQENPKGEKPMTKPVEAPKPVEAKGKSEIEIQAAFKAVEAKRKEGIRASFKPHMESEGVDALLNTAIDDMDMTEGQANASLLAHLAVKAEPIAAARVEVGISPAESFKADAIASLEMRAGLKPVESGNPLVSYSLGELARASNQVAGIKEQGSKMDVISAAFTHTSSDFTSLISTIANKTMQKGFDEAGETYESWTTVGTLSDFKETKRVDVNAFSDLNEVPDGSEYKYGTMGDSGEPVKLLTHGSLFSLTRQTIINDDLGGFTRTLRLMGRAANRKIGDLVYGVLTDNANMADAVALFHASHSNLLTGAVISTTSVDLMRVAMATNTSGGATTGARLSTLIVPVALEGAAKVVAESQFEVGASAKTNTIPNSVRGTFNVVSDYRLDASSASTWYGAVSSAMHETIEVSYLDGMAAPVLEEKEGWNVDGVEYKVRIDAGVKALAYQSLAKNPN